MSATKKNQLISIVVIYIVIAIFFVQSLSLKQDAGFFPRILSVCIGILNTIELIKILKEEPVVSKKKKEEIEPKKLYWILGLSSLYVVGLKPLGFIISTLLYLTITMNVLNVKSKKVILLTSVLTVAVIYVSFGVLLKVPMPKGILGF